MKTMLSFALISLSFLFFRCDDDINACSGGGAVDECVTTVQGSLFFKKDISAYVIRYFVPGTIDSHKTGVICKSEAGTIDLDRSINTTVVFSGCFLDDNDEIQPTMMLGGEEFYYLDLTHIELND
jgi:hypothetical protein